MSEGVDERKKSALPPNPLDEIKDVRITSNWRNFIWLVCVIHRSSICMTLIVEDGSA